MHNHFEIVELHVELTAECGRNVRHRIDGPGGGLRPGGGHRPAAPQNDSPHSSGPKPAPKRRRPHTDSVALPPKSQTKPMLFRKVGDVYCFHPEGNKRDTIMNIKTNDNDVFATAKRLKNGKWKVEVPALKTSKTYKNQTDAWRALSKLESMIDNKKTWLAKVGDVIDNVMDSGHGGGGGGDRSGPLVVSGGGVYYG